MKMKTLIILCFMLLASDLSIAGISGFSTLEEKTLYYKNAKIEGTIGHTLIVTNNTKDLVFLNTLNGKPH